jgi:hypothetical protein
MTMAVETGRCAVTAVNEAVYVYVADFEMNRRGAVIVVGTTDPYAVAWYLSHQALR